MSELKTVGIKELKNNLSAYLREVRRGVRVLVSDRNRIVAELHEPGVHYGTDEKVDPVLAAWVEAGVVKYNCIIHVDNTDLALKPGMTATVNIEVEHRDDVLTVPNAALRYVPPWPQEELEQVRADLDTSQAILWRVKGATLAPVNVATGIIGEEITEVSGTGLAVGMTIAVPVKRKDNDRKRRFGLSLF